MRACWTWIVSRLLGIALCTGLAFISFQLVELERGVFGQPYLDALIIAILVGAAIRTAWQPASGFQPGIQFSAKPLLEFAVALLGASVSIGKIAETGPLLVSGIIAIVVISIGAGLWICQALRVPIRMAILIACGNAICGNSAIVALAPVIGADEQDVAASIAFTAILGVLLVVALPLFVPLLNLSQHQYGVLAGLTVYAVPQVIAATSPVGLVSTQVGTLVKLVRVLMLGPMVMAFMILAPRLVGGGANSTAPSVQHERIALSKVAPWFILGFLTLAALRSLELVPFSLRTPISDLAATLTVVSMGALGLGVDLRAVIRVGRQVALAVSASLAVLILISLALIAVMPNR
ncbi:putative sulfate exporter family transporter [Methylobacterium bullatum]|uniref:YeiH family protein n=1 Tax=Methylobacterium bullatum TaxID=570505 RepID=UPI0017808FF5|nr:hypothetical protein [Methylobacterium bullatum]